MCIHHITHHASCGHTTQKINDIVKCYPVIKALNFYHDQPNQATQHIGRCFGLETMRMPENCGASYVHNLRTVTFVGQSRNITPEGWQPNMTKFARHILRNGEDIITTIMLLETEFPVMTDRISEAWIYHLKDCFHAHGLSWYPETDLQNHDLAGDIVIVSDHRGCGRFSTGDPRCFKAWNNPEGGMSYCPHIARQDKGIPIMTRSVHDTRERLQGNGAEIKFEERVSREMAWQWQTFRWNGPDPGPPFTTIPPSPPETSPISAPAWRCSSATDYCWPPNTTRDASSTPPPPPSESGGRRASMPGQDSQTPTQPSFAENVHDDVGEDDDTCDHTDGNIVPSISCASDVLPAEKERL